MNEMAGQGALAAMVPVEVIVQLGEPDIVVGGQGDGFHGKDEGGRMKDEVLILPLKLKAGMGVSARKVETREQAELRRERVESITRRAPEVVITRRWIHTASHFDGQEAVVVKLPWLQRLRNWMLDAGI